MLLLGHHCCWNLEHCLLQWWETCVLSLSTRVSLIKHHHQIKIMCRAQILDRDIEECHTIISAPAGSWTDQTRRRQMFNRFCSFTVQYYDVNVKLSYPLSGGWSYRHCGGPKWTAEGERCAASRNPGEEHHGNNGEPDQNEEQLYCRGNLPKLAV